MAKEELVKLEGTVEHIVFTSEETGFTVLDLDADDELITVVGTLPAIAPGEEVTLTGTFGSHPTYGHQFRAELCERTLPATASAIYKYLASGAIKGIGPRIARRIVDAFGDEALEIIEKEPERLAEIHGISANGAMDIHEEYKKIFGIRSIMLELSKYGVEASAAIRAWKKWGPLTLELLKENPYILCEEPVNTSFEQADEIALSLEVSPSSPLRIRAGMQYVLLENQSNGHTCLPEDMLVPTTASVLGVERYLVEDALEQAILEEYMIRQEVGGEVYLYLPELYEAETYIAGRITLMLQDIPLELESYDMQIDLLEEELEIEYAELQRRAIAMALQNRIFILTGGPGTGKTTALNGILGLLETQGENVALAAPTGRAAMRMSEVCQRDAKTIHRLLEVDYRMDDSDTITFKRNEKNLLRHDTVILDEVSMVDIPLMCSLLRALPLGCRLILVGDPDQLPSVGPGNILADLIESDVIPMIHLSEIFRQARSSRIVTSSHEIVKGDYPDLSVRDSDFFFLNQSSYDNALHGVIALTKVRLPKAYNYSPLWDIQVIAPSRVGPLGTVELNRHLQEHLNPADPKKIEHRFGAVVYREQDKVMQIRNNYDIVWVRDNDEEGTGVFNGDIGTIELINRPSQTVLIRYEDRVAEYNFDMMNEIEHAYAITVHKSQGSEFPAVVMPLMDFRSRLYNRNILYTAITRAKELMIILGQPQTISHMIDNFRRTQRYTNLKEYLVESVLGGSYE